jgi:hypothetical protein
MRVAWLVSSAYFWLLNALSAVFSLSPLTRRLTSIILSLFWLFSRLESVSIKLIRSESCLRVKRCCTTKCSTYDLSNISTSRLHSGHLMLQLNYLLERLLDLTQRMLCHTILQIGEVRDIAAGVTEVVPSPNFLGEVGTHVV